MSKISKRLEIITSLVNKKHVCDVGCDHGMLAYNLIKTGKVNKIIVSDISAPSLQKAIDLLTSKNCKFEAICCDGLSEYKDKKVDQCIITGMGGDEMIKIISSSPISVQSFILAPQHNNIGVKKYMIKHGYEIDFDIIILDKGKFYNIFRLNKCETPKKYEDYDLYFGKDNFVDKRSNIKDFVAFETLKIEKILQFGPIDNKELMDYYKLLLQYNKKER